MSTLCVCKGLDLIFFFLVIHFLQVSPQSAGRRDGALGGPEAGNRSAEEEAGGTGGETHGQDPGTVQVRR